MPSRMHPTRRTHTTGRPPRRLIAGSPPAPGSGTVTEPRPCEGRRLQGTPSRRVERYTYDAYGQPAVYNASWTAITEGASKDNALRFCGYVYDADVGLYHVRHRTYNAPLGRWLQRDPAGYVDGMGLYEYAMSSPIVNCDPQGLFIEDRNDIGGSDEDGTFDYEKAGKYFYTARCGWIDKGHFGWGDVYSEALKGIETKRKTTLTAKALGIKVNAEFLRIADNRGRTKDLTYEQATYAAFALTIQMGRSIERAQFAAESRPKEFTPHISAVYNHFKSGFSQEDMATNILAAHFQMVNARLRKDNKPVLSKTDYIVKHCGPVLTKGQACSLYDKMTSDEKTVRHNWMENRLLPGQEKYAPILYTAHCKALNLQSCADAKPAELYGLDAVHSPNGVLWNDMQLFLGPAKSSVDDKGIKEFIKREAWDKLQDVIGGGE